MDPKCIAIENEIRDIINELEEEYEVKLSTTQKILLSINGPITTILDVLYGKVRLFMLDQHFEKADETLADFLGINEGDEVLYRNSIVFKRRQPLVHVDSYIPKERCDPAIIDELINGKLTTGKIMDQYGVESLRKLNYISIEKSTPILTELFKTNEDMLTREYSMIHNEEVIILTKETYPLSYFKI